MGLWEGRRRGSWVDLGKGCMGGIVHAGRYLRVCKDVWHSLKGQKEEGD